MQQKYIQHWSKLASYLQPSYLKWWLKARDPKHETGLLNDMQEKSDGEKDKKRKLILQIGECYVQTDECLL